MTATELLLDALRQHGSTVRTSTGRQHMATCPAHEDRTPSLSVTSAETRVLVKCQAGCDVDDVLAALSMTRADLFDEPRQLNGSAVMAAYRYTDEDGRLLFEVVRKDGKRFHQRRPDGVGGWVSNLRDVRRVLYRLPEVLNAARTGATVYVVEGEKDADRLASAGVVATTSPGGAGKWRSEYGDALTGADVVVVADRDEPGYAHARAVAADLSGRAKSVRVVEPVEGKDVSDHLAPGHTLDELVPMGTTGDGEGVAVLGSPEATYPFTSGGSFILDTPTHPEPLWGSGSEVLLADGESLIIAGPQGLGKTTLAQQLGLGRCGFGEYAELLGYPVKPGATRTLYLAMDRPRQAARSFRRMVGAAWRDELDDRLVVWQGPPPADLAKHTGLLLDLCRKADADTVIVDSLKDAAVGLNDDEVGSSYNRARQTAATAGVQIVELHHNRKTGSGTKNRHPTIDDLYGSTWLPSGAGSILLLSGAPGDPIVGLHHIKQPADEVGPFKVIHDHDAGRSTVWHVTDLATLATGPGGISALDAARVLFDSDKPTASEREKARRRLDKLAASGVVRVVSEGDRSTNQPTLWGAI